MSELKSGVDLNSEFSSLGFEDKKQKVLQKFGGLAFSESGNIVSRESALPNGKPVDSYVEWVVNKLRRPLEAAAHSPVIQGWKSNGVDSRIEKFLTGGGPEKVLAGVDQHQKCLIHGDFTISNILFDGDAKKVTALLGFDWSSVSHPYDQISSCLHDIGCNVDCEDGNIGPAILSGNFSTPPAHLDEKTTEKWRLAKEWYTAMKKSGVVTPGDMKGVDNIRDMSRLHGLLCPFKLGNENELKEMDDETKADLRAKTEADLVQWLQKHGF
ncbi:Protein kinase-like domain protein [Metarhizium rileyi]|uniref:Protein kinase-like domain protein n=1 Tax=Metarhizium rileyi (strain RCEF 4871) TaxID=1649241 RepID=A0A166Y2F6_METRR|nr:Protein kinase-like domain protein [Metarhizium rileyi RCEF 4871]